MGMWMRKPLREYPEGDRARHLDPMRQKKKKKKKKKTGASAWGNRFLQKMQKMRYP